MINDNSHYSRSSSRAENGRSRAYAPGDRSIAEGIHPWDIARRVWHRRNVILVTIAAGLMVALVVFLVSTPKYSAQSRILLESADSSFLDRNRVPDPSGSDSQAIASQIQVLQSERLAEHVIQSLQLDLDPEFNKNLKRAGLVGSVVRAIETALPHRRPSTEEQAELERTKVLDEFSKRVTAYQLGNSRVIALEFTSEDPIKTQRITNALADAYVEDQIQAKLDINRRGSAWLADQIATLNKAVQRSEQAVEDFRQKSGLLKGTSATLDTQNLSDLNSQVLAAHTNRAALEARAARIASLMKAGGNLDSVAEVQQSPVIQKLKEQEVALQSSIAEMSVKYLPTNPELIKAKAALDDLHATMRGEVNRIIAGLRNEAEIARRKEASLEKQFAELKGTVGAANTAEVKLRELEREAAADRALLESFMTMHKETVAQDSGNILSADARIIARARLPIEPSFPRPAALFGLAGFVSLLIGFLIVAVLELRDRGFTDADALEQATNLRILGIVPRVAANVSCLWLPAATGRNATTPEFVEAWRSIQTALLVAAETENVKTVIISSANAREGKTTATLNLSRMLAAGGRKTILIDADMRKPQAHQALGLGEGPGLGDVLAGAAQLDDVVRTDEPTGLAVLRAGRRTDNPATLLSSKAMDEVLNRLRRDFDMIIIDTSPIVEVADAQALYSKADLTILLVRWQETRRRAVVQALRLLNAGGARIGGLLLSMADPRRVPHYGYGDYLTPEATRQTRMPPKPIWKRRRAARRSETRSSKPTAVAPIEEPAIAPSLAEGLASLSDAIPPHTAIVPVPSPPAPLPPEALNDNNAPAEDEPKMPRFKWPRWSVGRQTAAETESPAPADAPAPAQASIPAEAAGAPAGPVPVVEDDDASPIERILRRSRQRTGGA
jgi:succinoglycan biosynthesis transport protein ExoP